MATFHSTMIKKPRGSKWHINWSKSLNKRDSNAFSTLRPVVGLIGTSSPSLISVDITSSGKIESMVFSGTLLQTSARTGTSPASKSEKNVHFTTITKKPNLICKMEISWESMDHTESITKWLQISLRITQIPIQRPLFNQILHHQVPVKMWKKPPTIFLKRRERWEPGALEKKVFNKS